MKGPTPSPTRYEFNQGMIKTKLKIEELFFPASLQEVQRYL